MVHYFRVQLLNSFEMNTYYRNFFALSDMNKISVRLADSTSRTENSNSRKRSSINEDDRKRDSRKRKRVSDFRLSCYISLE